MVAVMAVSEELSVSEVIKEVGIHLVWCLGLLLSFFSGWLTFFSILCSWWFRDGLGPDSETSHGAEAWGRWWEGMAGSLTPFLYLALAFCVGVLICCGARRLDLWNSRPTAPPQSP
jgi:hypothetical protein